MRVKEESERAGLKPNIQKTKIMASGPIISWQIEGEKVETVKDFFFLGFKITVDGDCSHEIKRCLLLGRKAMTNLDSILKSRDIILPTKVHIKVQKSCGFSGSCVGMWELDHKEGWAPKNWRFQIVVLDKTLESPLDCKEIKPVNPKNSQPSWEGLLLKQKLQYCGHLMWRADSLEKTLMLGKIEGKRRRGWQRMRWLDSISTQWTWVWANSRRQWRTEDPCMLQSIESKRVRRSSGSEQQGCAWDCQNLGFVLFDQRFLIFLSPSPWEPPLYSVTMNSTLLDSTGKTDHVVFVFLCLALKILILAWQELGLCWFCFLLQFLHPDWYLEDRRLWIYICQIHF